MFRILVRYCSQVPTKAETKISWNRDNKQLFGPVAKVKKPRKNKKNESAGKCEIATEKQKQPVEPILSSEMHWMLGSASNRRRMLARNIPNARDTERIVLKVKHPVEEKKYQQNKSAFSGILKVPLITREGEEWSEIPEIDSSERPSVGKILQATMTENARNALIQWKLSKVEELGEDGFAALQKANLNRGLKFHNMLQEYFTKTGEEDMEPLSEDHPNYLVWKSVQSVLPEVDKEALFVETRVQHPVLKYKGVVDCVSCVSGNVYGIEWKNSEKSKPTIAATFDAPLQLAAYVGALNATREHAVEITCGMVVVAYENGRPADFFKLNEAQLTQYWYAWLLRVQEYWIRHRDGTLPEPIF